MTLSLMVLLTLIGVGMLSLSAIGLRTSSQAEHQANARANARLSLMLALGELQKELGPDQRISAVSGILGEGDAQTSSVDHPHLTGVWDSRDDELGDVPAYGPEGSFRRWLVSAADPDALTQTGFARNGRFDEAVILASDPAAAGGAGEVRAGKVSVPGTRSAFAWWVGDENSKGYTNPADSREKDSTDASLSQLLDSAATPGAFGMLSISSAYPANTGDSGKALSHSQLALLAAEGRDAGKWFHDLSPHPRGLLTDVVKGGMRKDLSLYLELPRSNDAWPRSPAPAALGPNGSYALSEVDAYDVLPWKYLHSHAQLKDRLQMVDGRPTLPAWRGPKGVRPSDALNPRWNAGVPRIGPVITRLLLFMAYGSVRDPSEPGKYVMRLYSYPVLTLWNPYNVDLVVRPHELNTLSTSFPMKHDISVNGVIRERYDWRVKDAGTGMKPVLNIGLTLKPGEARLLTPVSWNWDPTHIHHHIHYMEDVPFNYSSRFAGGPWGAGKNYDRPITLAKGIGSDRIRIATDINKWGREGGAFVMDYQSTWDFRGNHAPSDDGDWQTYQWASKVGWRYEDKTPPEVSPNHISATNQPSATFAEVLDAPRPFMVVDARLKALDEDHLPNKTWRDCIPSHPFQAVTRTPEDPTPYFAGAYKLAFNSINSFQEAASYVQTSPDDPANTYFGGSYFPQNGQSFITDREIPLSPLTSLAQLQHVPQHSIDNMYSSGFFFQNHAIGNSFASPGVPSDAVRAPGWPFVLDMWSNSHGGTIDGKKYPSGYYHQRPNIDRSYAANHLLWDGYFFSSMAAKDDPLRGRAGRMTLTDVVSGFYKDGLPLPNERYVPYVKSTPEEAIERLVRGRATPNGFREVAGTLMVEGAFNVNSVSVDAWKTMIASAHRKRIVIMETSGGPKVESPASYVVSRFSMPNGGSANATAGRAGEDLRWRGYRELDEDQVGELAVALVKQVKARGPFRSLGEFINRRLGPESDERTRYGAIQAALEDPEVSINADYRGMQISAGDLGGAIYQNPTAALGSRYEGSPAYVSQADLLNSMGSVLSARSDTFLVRSYGESRDAGGRVVAKAWCEAVVQRVPDFMESADAPETAAADLNSGLNRRFGRRMIIENFRWMSPHEL